MSRLRAALAVLAAAAPLAACGHPSALRAGRRPGAREIYIPGYGPAPAAAERTAPVPGGQAEEGFDVAMDTEPFLSVSPPVSAEGGALGPAVSVDSAPAQSEAVASTAAFHAQLVQDIVAARLAGAARNPVEPMKPMSEAGKRPPGQASDRLSAAAQAIVPGAPPKLAIGGAPNLPQVGPQTVGLPMAKRMALPGDVPGDAPSIGQFAGDLESIMYSEMLLAGSYQVQIATSAEFSEVLFEKAYNFTADIDLQGDLYRAGAEDGYYFVRVAFVDLLNYHAPFSKPRVYKFARRR